MFIADEKLEGGPSVPFDAVALFITVEGAAKLASRPAARDFIADAVAHQKFIGYIDSSTDFVKEVCGKERFDGGFVKLRTPKDCKEFVTRCGDLRFWERSDVKW